MAEHFAGPRHGHHHALRGLGVGPHQAADAQFGAAEVASDHYDHIAQAAALQHSQHRPPCRPGRLTIVGGMGYRARPAAHNVGRNVMRGVGEFPANAGDEGPRVFDGGGRGQRRNKAGIDDHNFALHLAGRHRVGGFGGQAHAGLPCSAR